MTTSRLAVLLAVMLAGLSCVFLLPRQLRFQPVGIDLDLPKMVGGMWYGRDLAVSDLERNTLGEGTEFARKSYTDARGREIMCSVVLSGQDMNTSIHRPERCLPAQGWTVATSEPVAIPLGDRGGLVATRLYNIRYVTDKEGKSILGPDGKPLILHNINYYWFVGYSDVTSSHIDRNRIDIMDRLFKGYNQRWAYVTVAANVVGNAQEEDIAETRTDEMMKEFIKKLVPSTHKESVVLK